MAGFVNGQMRHAGCGGKGERVNVRELGIHACAVSVWIPVGILALRNDEDRQFVTRIYMEYRELMYKVARKQFGSHEADIEDAMSAAVEQMCMYVESLRTVEEGNMKSYVLRVMGNVCRKQRMAQRARDAHRDCAASEETIENIADTDDPYASVFDHADAVALLASFTGLSEREKELIRLKHIDQLENSEIAERLRMSEGAVRTALLRAKRHLRTLASERKCDLP